MEKITKKPCLWQVKRYTEAALMKDGNLKGYCRATNLECQPGLCPFKERDIEIDIIIKTLRTMTDGLKVINQKLGKLVQEDSCLPTGVSVQ